MIVTFVKISCLEFFLTLIMANLSLEEIELAEKNLPLLVAGMQLVMEDVEAWLDYVYYLIMIDLK